MLSENSESIDWTYGVVAFLDVLGFSSFVAADAKSTKPKYLERIISSIQSAKSSEHAKGLDVRAFSDSIVISTELTPVSVCSLFLALIELQRLFLAQEVLIRGGVAFGKHHSRPDAIYSEALITACELERDKARFPRILIDADLLDWVQNDPFSTPELASKINLCLLRDRDNLVFLDYLGVEILDVHIELLKSYNVEGVTASVLEKLQWLAGYHNYKAGLCGRNWLADGSLVVPFRPV